MTKVIFAISENYLNSKRHLSRPHIIVKWARSGSLRALPPSTLYH